MKFEKPRLLTELELNIIRGKSLEEERVTAKELMQVFSHYDLIEQKLDTLDYEDFFGTEGWRHFFGLPDAD
jgi:hypothetical protein